MSCLIIRHFFAVFFALSRHSFAINSLSPAAAISFHFGLLFTRWRIRRLLYDHFFSLDTTQRVRCTCTMSWLYAFHEMLFLLRRHYFALIIFVSRYYRGVSTLLPLRQLCRHVIAYAAIDMLMPFAFSSFSCFLSLPIHDDYYCHICFLFIVMLLLLLLFYAIMSLRLSAPLLAYAYARFLPLMLSITPRCHIYITPDIFAAIDTRAAISLISMLRHIRFAFSVAAVVGGRQVVVFLRHYAMFRCRLRFRRYAGCRLLDFFTLPCCHADFRFAFHYFAIAFHAIPEATLITPY